jgi:hypothetical protein
MFQKPRKTLLLHGPAKAGLVSGLNIHAPSEHAQSARTSFFAGFAYRRGWETPAHPDSFVILFSLFLKTA